MPLTGQAAIGGLSDGQVKESRIRHGSNKLKKVGGKTFFSRYLESFSDPMIRILLMALAINLIFLLRTHVWYEPLAIAVSIFIATTISTLSEHGSQSAFERLREEASKTRCRVIREGFVKEIPIEEIVVGDFVMLAAGDTVPADGCLYSGCLEVNQAALTGETKEAIKRPNGRVCKTDDLTAGNAVYRGSAVTGGEGVFIVNRVGDNTFYGRLAREVQTETRESPMRVRLLKLAKTISKIGYSGAAMVAAAYIFRIIYKEFDFSLPMFVEYYSSWNKFLPELLNVIMLSVTVIVVSVPEGLPMMITVVLSANMKKMLNDNVLVRKMVGIETAGSMNILFTDKTGTLTCGSLSVSEIITGSGKTFDSAQKLKKSPEFLEIFRVSAYYNNGAGFSKDGDAVGGNATDRALLRFITAREQPQKIKLIKKVPFDSERKFSLVHTEGYKYKTLIKGAPEKILPYCNYFLDEYGNNIKLDKAFIETTISERAKKAVRLLAMAVSENINDSESGEYSLLCLIGIVDRVRPECRESVARLKKAGIQVVMVTGDNKETAKAVASDCGITVSDKDWVSDSKELSSLSDDEIEKRLGDLRVVARALPSDKSRLVRIAQKKGFVAGMTGDGVNDAPALKAADVGFSMGSGSDVAKEASDIVILDNNIQSVTKAVMYGRTIFKSIRKFVTYQLTVNICAVGLSVIAPFFGVDTPVTIMQMLWINLVMDTLGGLAFSGEPAREKYMTEKPKKRDENILNKYMISQILWMGFYSLMLCLLFLRVPILSNYLRQSGNSEYFMTALFALFMFMAIFNSLNARTHNINLGSHISGNKPFVFIMGIVFIVQSLMIYIGGRVFRTADLTFTEFIITLLLAFTVIPADILRKLILKKKGKLNGV
jgi:calcium-translocating P-type ATPase